MKTPLRLIVTLGAVVALTAACNPFGASSRERLPEDPRFAEFTFDSDNKPTVQERTDSFNERWPGLQATEGHVTIEYSPSDLLPNPDPELWVTGVATVPDETITALMEGTTSSALLPGIYPGLYQYVPQDCHFVTIPADHANTVLQTKANGIYSDWGSFTVTDFAASADCNLIIVTGEGTTG
ncbi:MAG: hypothetical protein ACLRG2_08795 [Pauljensenia sp.]